MKREKKIEVLKEKGKKNYRLDPSLYSLNKEKKGDPIDCLSRRGRRFLLKILL